MNKIIDTNYFFNPTFKMQTNSLSADDQNSEQVLLH